MDGEWKTALIGELASVRTERVMPEPESDLAYVGLEHIEAESGRLLGQGRAGDTVSLKTPFEVGDILYGKLRPALRKVLRAPFCGVATTEILAIVPRDPGDAAFIEHVLHADEVLAWALQGAEGTKMPRTSWNRLSRFRLLCPSREERQAIGHTLDAIDEAIEKTEAVIAATEDLRKALLQELLTRGVPGWHTEWKTVQGIGTIPACWDVVRLGEVAEFQYGTSAKCDANNSATPVLRIPNVAGGVLELSDLKYARLPDRELRALRLTDGDLLFVRTNGNPTICGRVARVRGLEGDWAFASYLVRLRTLAALYPTFLWHYFSDEDGRRALSKHIRTSAGNFNLSVSGVRQIEVPLPPRAEQQGICELVASTDERLEQDRHLLTHLRAIKQEAASALLSGRVRIRRNEVP